MNKMIVNPDKYQAIVLNKKRSNLTKTNFHVYNQVIKLVSSVELLGIQIDDKLNFNLHISKICKSAANQLNALIRLKQFLSFHTKEVLINSYIISNFNYSPLVWMFSSTQSRNKIEICRNELYVFCMMILKHITKIYYKKEGSLKWMLGD